MRKWLAAIGAAATVALLTGTACADTVKVGVIGVFSGGFARWGEQFKQAIEVYQKHRRQDRQRPHDRNGLSRRRRA